MSDLPVKPLSARHVLPRLLATALLSGLGGCGLFSDSKPPATPRIAPPETLYNDGIDALQTHRFPLAASQFESLQQNYPYSGYIANAQLMEGYAYYLQGRYPDAVQQINRFISLHPTSPDAAYAYYLRALCFYEQIADVQRDQQGTIESMDALEEVITRFPQTKYARDAQLKIDLCRDHLAGKEMLVGRYYQREGNYEAAVNRYQRVIQDFQTTNHVPEALERMVEVYLDLGLVDQARKAATVLGYNYPGSQWYHYAYNKLKSHKLLDGKLPLPGKLVTAAETQADLAGAKKGTAPAPSALAAAPARAPQPMAIKKAPVSPVKAEPVAAPQGATDSSQKK
ncbi:outer membrane protein assembly factor BamD [Acetobacter vaccinii]|uniref:Outer membrane protein assembly factor BamD n=1 Tax=Acetobacter vaccinii TaxID=2592655 RepID=A0A5C1YN63_9PROT|nr:outer membrane protein assembly factor BamD [Acetobacter vaccinii]QEO17736.1 outer membrane protein assembly factor BamD [Acetobacter vaccinii]